MLLARFASEAISSIKCNNNKTPHRNVAGFIFFIKMYPIVYRFSFSWKLDRDSLKPKDLIYEIENNFYHNLRYSDGEIKGGYMTPQSIEVYRNILFSQEKLSQTNQVIQAFILANFNQEEYKFLPSTNKTILTKEIDVSLIPSRKHPFDRWELEMNYISEEYTVIGEKSIANNILKAFKGNLFSSDSSNNEELELYAGEAKKLLVAAKGL